MDLSVASMVGFVAGMCSAGSFVPQVVKAWREGDTEAISKRMYVVTVSAFSLWIVYGVMIGSWPIIAFNAISLLLSGAILALKMRKRKPAAARGAAG